MTLSAWTCVFCAYPGNDDLHLNCACCQQTRADRLLQPHEFERIHAHDRAMQEERERATKTRYCAITDEMVPVDEDFVTRNPILLKDLIKRVGCILKPQPKSVSKPISAEKLIEAIMDRMEQDQAFHKDVMIDLAVLYGCEAEKPE